MNKLVSIIKKKPSIFLIIGTIIFELIFYAINTFLDIDAYNLLNIIFLLLVITTLSLMIKKKKIDFFYLIFFIGIIIRTIYIYKTSVYENQHDVLGLLDNGHLGYIYTLFKSHHLPTTNTWQFYHPPLWHFLGAIWLNINDLFKINISKSIEGLQILTLLFSSILIIITNNLCTHLKINDKNRYLILSLFAIHPTLILYSGFINNDCLLLLLESLIIINLINWYNTPNYKNTILLAITIGLSAMTKANGIIMVIPCIYVFIKKILEKKKEKRNFLRQGILFSIISVPLASWYQIRNYLNFSSIAIAVPSDHLYIGNHSIFERFLIFSFKQLFNNNPMKNYNLPSYIVRSSTIGDFQIQNNNILFKLLIIFNLILIVISIIFTLKYLYSKEKNIIVNTLIITWITSLIAMYIFNYKYPYVCSMNIRYISINIYMILMIGYGLNVTSNIKIKKIIKTVSYIFIFLSILFVFGI